MEKVFFVIILLLLVVASSARAENYYVDKESHDGTCNDSNPGTLSQPWCTIGKANSTLQPGDTVYIRQGTYRETIRPSRSGQVGSYITYKQYGNEDVIVRDTSYGIRLDAVEYIKVKGIKFYNPRQRWFYLTYADHNIIEECEFDGANTGMFYYMAKMEHSNYNVFDRIRITADDIPENSNTSHDLFGFDDSSHNLVIDSIIGDVSHSTIHGRHGNLQYNVFWKNGFSNKWEQGFGGLAGRYLMQGNTFHGVGRRIEYCPWFGSRTNPALNPALYTNGAQHSIIRHNIFYENDIDIFLRPGNSDSAYNWIYHNTLYNTKVYNSPANQNKYNGTHIFSEGDQAYDLKYEHIINNIIWKGESSYQATFYNYGGGSIHSNTISHNIFGDPEKESKINYNKATNSLSWHQSNTPSQWHNNLLDAVGNPADPLMVDPDNLDFTLKSNSPCIDAATHLALTSGTGNNSTSLLVDHADPFFSGPGAPWFISHPEVEADYIFVEGAGRNQIASIDYQSNTLILKNPMDWEDNKKVYLCPGGLCFRGGAPDIGAFEYQASILYGDVSENGQISAYDASLTAQYTVGNIGLTDTQKTKADVTGNLQVSASDASWIAKKVVDPSVVFPVEE